MRKLVRKTFIDTVTQYLIDKGADIVDISSPLGACKLALEKIEEHNRDSFIEQVIQGLSKVDIESLDAVKSLQRLYKSLQVISKATTQDKINRFKNLTINGICQQEMLSDVDYDLFVRLTDTLTDAEFMYLAIITKYIPRGLSKKDEESTRTQFNDATKRALSEIKQVLSIDDEKLHFIRNSLSGFGLIKLAAAFGGLAFNGMSDIAYDYIEFIQDNGEVSDAE